LPANKFTKYSSDSSFGISKFPALVNGGSDFGNLNWS